MNTMIYKGYAARIEYSDDDQCFIGHIAGINDVVGFHGDSVNDYLATCKKLGREPQKPYSGRMMLRVPPEVHARAMMMAQAHVKSLNQWAADVLANAQ
jgi:predicted HicB family RNase H-like nuclease